MALAKVRGLHPDFFSDDDVAEVSIPARLLFAGLWCFACDNGHLADKPKQIKRWIFATDDINCAGLLTELEEQGLVERDAGFIVIPGLTKRQRIDYRYFKSCERQGCEPPPKKGDSQPETRSGPAVTTASPVVTTRGPATDGDGDGDGDISCAPTDVEREFAEWYDAYPRKRGRGQALKAYKAARKKVDAETLLRSIRQQSAALLASGPAYVPYPATWLNGERWDDQPDAAVIQLPTADDGRLVLPPLPKGVFDR